MNPATERTRVRAFDAAMLRIDSGITGQRAPRLKVGITAAAGQQARLDVERAGREAPRHPLASTACKAVSKHGDPTHEAPKAQKSPQS